MNQRNNSQMSDVRCQMSRRGQSLIETLVALSIITVAFFAMIGLLSSSLRYSRAVSDDYLATYLAAEGIEIVKNIVDSNFLQSRPFNDGLGSGDYEVEWSSCSVNGPCSLQEFSGLGRPILFDQSTRFYGYTGEEQTPFTRMIRISSNCDVNGDGIFEFCDLNGDGFLDMIRANSIVAWTAAGGAQKTVNLEDEFYDWRP